MRRNKLVIIAHLPHYCDGNTSFAYEPYVREIEVWSELFAQIIIYTDLVDFRPDFPVKEMPLNCKIIKVPMKAGPGLKANLTRLIQLPFVFIQLLFVVIKSDLLHLRSPGITTFMVNCINRIFNKPVIVKWATQFAPMPIPDKILHWELRLLKSPPTNTKVLIYGISHHPNHISFIPALMHKKELRLESQIISPKLFSKPLRIIFVGRLFRYKEFDQVVLALDKVNKERENLSWVLNVIGDGEDLDKLKILTHEKGLSDKIKFLGQKSFKETCEIYATSDISIIPGRYEGWSKVINESWNYGVIPMVTSGGNTAYPIRISNGAGIVYKEDLSDFVEKFEFIAGLSIEEITAYRKKGYLANNGMSLESFKEKLEKVLDDNFN